MTTVLNNTLEILAENMVNQVVIKLLLDKKPIHDIQYLQWFDDPCLLKYHRFGFYCWTESPYVEPGYCSIERSKCYSSSVDFSLLKSQNGKISEEVRDRFDELVQAKIQETIRKEV